MLTALSYSVILLHCSAIYGQLGLLGPSKTTTESLVKGYGYPFEEYNVQTEDGYILKIFRIPFSPKNENSTAQKPVVFMMHGFGQSSADWILSGSPRSLGLLLADNGYDVWLGNARGTRYSRAHIKYSPLDPAFWRFSWHEIGIYDLPANIDYIQRSTLSSKIQYIGHSQGTTAFLVATSTVDGFNEHIKSAYLFAPVAFLSHAPNVLLSVLAPFFGQPNFIAAFGDFEIFRNSRLVEIISDLACGKESPVKELCLDASYLLYGWGSKETNQTALQIFLKTVPEGASVKQLFHYLQLYNSKKFRQFDYGNLYNSVFYHQSSPPDYQLQNITTPIFMYHSQNDALSDPEDVNILANLLPSNALKKLYKMPMKDWNHIDFILAYNVNEVLYDMVLEDLQSV